MMENRNIKRQFIYLLVDQSVIGVCVMNIDEYQKLQEANKRVYELLIDEEQKQKILSKMMGDEINFMIENLSPIEIKEQISDNLVNFCMSAKPSKDDANLLFVRFEKLTLENFFDKVTLSCDSGKEDALKEVLAKDPEALQKICDEFNAALKDHFITQFANQGVKITENDNMITISRSAESIQDPDKEVENIIRRSNNCNNSLAREHQTSTQNYMQADDKEDNRYSLEFR